MECPHCSHENLAGADTCAGCGTDLADLAGFAERHSSVEKALFATPLRELAVRDYIEAPPDLPVREVLRRLRDNGSHCAMILADGVLLGIFTERDALMKLADRFDAAADGTVRDFMTVHPEVLDPSAPVAFGLNRMMVGGYRHIPLVADGRLEGVVSVRHALAFLVQQLDQPAPAVR